MRVKVVLLSIAVWCVAAMVIALVLGRVIRLRSRMRPSGGREEVPHPRRTDRIA
jgi:hypothetical protein